MTLVGPMQTTGISKRTRRRRLTLMSRHAEASGHHSRLFDSRATAVGGMNDRFVVGDLRFGFTYYPVDEVDERIGAVLSGKWPDYRYYSPEAFAAGMSAAQPLWDPEAIIMRWRGSLDPMPHTFRRKAIQELVFESRADLEDLKRARDLGDITFYESRSPSLAFAAHDLCCEQGLVSRPEASDPSLTSRGDYRASLAGWSREPDILGPFCGATCARIRSGA